MAARWQRWLIGGSCVYVGSTALVYWLVRKDPQHEINTDCSPFDRLAPTYDQRMDKEEEHTGIKKLREKLLKPASGQVIEIAAGTGRNVNFYPDACVSLTLAEVSEPMLQTLSQKYATQIQANKITLVKADAKSLPFESNSFDTAVDTFGLCSIDDAEAAVRELARVVRPGGQIMFLEHGLSSFFLVNAYLNWTSQSHRQKWGCDHNKDIPAIIKSAGLRVITHNTYHAGTTHMITAQVD